MKVLVTGGTGFIGSHLVNRLLDDGHKVIVFDKLEAGREEPFAQHRNRKNLALVKVDVSFRDQIKPSYFAGVDWVFHLAALANVIPSITAPVEYHRVNVSGTVYVLAAAAKASVKRFIYAASASCYGIPSIFPTPETAEIHPEYPYALTKYLGEIYTFHWGRVYKFPVASLRLFHVYGPRVRSYGTYGPVISTFLAQKLAGKPYTIVGDGTQRRDFVYVSDVVEAFILAAKSKITNACFNVGSGKTVSVNHLAKLLGGPVIHIPKRPGEPDCTWADIGRITKTLGWKPKVSFEEGIKIVLQNIDYWRKAPVWTPSKIKKATKEWFKYLERQD